MISGTALVVQCLRLCTATEGGAGSNPGQGTNIAYAARGAKKKVSVH